MVIGAPWTSILTVTVVIAAMSFVASTIGNKQVDIANTDVARGFITVLFGVGTIGIALIVTLSGILLSDDRSKERFDRGKEVLSLLLGIFGTIVGFYYGTKVSSESTNHNSPPAAITQGSQSPAQIPAPTSAKQKTEQSAALEAVQGQPASGAGDPSKK
jgi:hypothetical protein